MFLRKDNRAMRKTRNLFVLHGSKEHVEQALNEIQFKGITILKDDEISFQSIQKVFLENKSVVCGQLGFYQFCLPVYNSIYSIVVHDDDSFSDIYPRQININKDSIASQFQTIAEQICNCDIGDYKS